MNNQTETAFLISLVILITMIAFVIWWYGVRRSVSGKRPTNAFVSMDIKDDLTLIDGIGKTLEKKLNSLGVTSFKQIAEFSDKDIERVNQELSFKGRISRENWMAQARKLVEAGSRPGSSKLRPDPGSAGKKKKAAGKGTRKSVTKTKENAH